MITQYFLGVFAKFLGQIYALFPAEPSWMSGFSLDLPTAGVIPSTVLNVLVPSWIAVWAGTGLVRFVRFVASYFTLGGG